MTVQVPLTRGLFALVDDEDAERVLAHKWYAASTKSLFYACREAKKGEPYTRTVLMHRFLINPPAGLIVDHADHDGLNNRRENLRLCSLRQNNTNKRCSKGRTSSYKGVNCYQNLSRPWRAKIKLYDKCIHLGYFSTEEEAALAYNQAALQLHGEFACLNELAR